MFGVSFLKTLKKIEEIETLNISDKKKRAVRISPLLLLLSGRYAVHYTHAIINSREKERERENDDDDGNDDDADDDCKSSVVVVKQQQQRGRLLGFVDGKDDGEGELKAGKASSSKS